MRYVKFIFYHAVMGFDENRKEKDHDERRNMNKKDGGGKRGRK